MSYDAIRDRLARHRDEKDGFSENEKLLLDALHQLTTVLEADLTQIKVRARSCRSLARGPRGLAEPSGAPLCQAGQLRHFLKFLR